LGCCWGAGGDVEGLKLRPPNASSRSPKLDCCCAGADCMPPKDGWRSCCGGGWGLGAEAYRERMDCFRSGLDCAVDPVGVDAELDGLPIEEDGGPPKKSRPNNESAALVCLGGPEDIGGGSRLPGVSVVLGLTGGSGTSPKRSTGGAARGGGGIGWLNVDAARNEAPRSSLAFSCTTLRGYYSIISIHSTPSTTCSYTTSSSSSASKAAGSGMGPSITHRLDSYLVLMKFSIFLVSP